LFLWHSNSAGKVEGYCNASIDDGSPSAPDWCGGSTTVTWTYTSDCDDDLTDTATFIVPDRVGDPVLHNVPDGGQLPDCTTDIPTCADFTDVYATDICITVLDVDCEDGGIVDLGDFCYSKTFTFYAVDECGNEVEEEVTFTWCCPPPHILPTATTCADYRDGTYLPMYPAEYSVKGGKINQANPGVFFYYNILTAPGSGNWVIHVGQSNDASWPDIAVQREDQFYLYPYESCIKLTDGITLSDNGTTLTVTSGNYVPSADYIIGVKFSLSSLKVYSGSFPTKVTYDFWTEVGADPTHLGEDSIDLNKK
jgi:hypothetical protein